MRVVVVNELMMLMVVLVVVLGLVDMVAAAAVTDGNIAHAEAHAVHLSSPLIVSDPLDLRPRFQNLAWEHGGV